MSREGWRTRRRRELSSEERVLWRKIAETVTPLAGRRIPPPDEIVEEILGAPSAPPSPPSPMVKPPPFPPQKPKAPPPLQGLEPQVARALKRGRIEVDARLDLHGLFQAEAHARLTSFLRGTQQRGGRMVLVITGKGRAGGPDAGVLRRMVPHWLGDPSLRSIVVGFSEADAQHGGSGALYVRLRRAERGRP